MKAPTAKELIKLRKRLGLTQIAMSEKLHINQSTLSRWENGVYEIPSFMRAAIDALKNI